MKDNNPLREFLLQVIEEEEDWYKDAVCAQTDPEMFFPQDDFGYTPKLALKICQTCPVRAKCLETALNNREEYGVWGGMIASKRIKMLRSSTRGRPRTNV